MARTKTTETSSITAAQLADGDQFTVVDVSDTTMSSTGTNKKLAKSELFDAFVPGTNWDEAVAGNSWVAGPRSTVTTIPVAAFYPTQANTVMALDVIPNGSPSTGPGGYAWIDVCDTDVMDNNDGTGVARVGIGSDYVRISSRAYGKTSLPLRLEVGDNVMGGGTGYLDILDKDGTTALTGTLRVHPTAPASYGGSLNVGAAAAGKALVIRAASAATGNLIETQDSSTVANFAVTASGKVATSAVLDATNGDQLITLVGGSSKCVTLGSAALTGITGNRVIAIPNAVSVPSGNATGGGVLYAEAGALKWRGSSGTITTLGAA